MARRKFTEFLESLNNLLDSYHGNRWEYRYEEEDGLRTITILIVEQEKKRG